MQLYLDNGYLNFPALRALPQPFVIAIGGRGTGKTYGALESSIDDGIIFAFMRRTQTQLDIINRPEFNPVKPVCRARGWQITTAPVARGLTAYYRYTVEDERQVLHGPPLGYNMALSTVANIRGFDASEIDLLIYDEAIPERGERPLPREFERLTNCYETLNRNRELQGRSPLKLVCLANANAQTAPILEGLGLVDVLDRMQRKGQTLYQDARRGLALVLLRDSPISAGKADTALYRLTAGSDYADMALNNTFAYEDRGTIRSMPLAEYRPIATAGSVTIYAHKRRRELYVSKHRAGSCPTYGTGDTDRYRFNKAWGGRVSEAIDTDSIIYETYEAQTLLTSYMS